MPRHDLDVFSLVAGVAFGAAALVFLVDRQTGLSGRWVWPILLIVIGVAGLVGTRRTVRSTPAQPHEPPAAPAESAE